MEILGYCVPLMFVINYVIAFDTFKLAQCRAHCLKTLNKRHKTKHDPSRSRLRPLDTGLRPDSIFSQSEPTSHPDCNDDSNCGFCWSMCEGLHHSPMLYHPLCSYIHNCGDGCDLACRGFNSGLHSTQNEDVYDFPSPVEVTRKNLNFHLKWSQPAAYLPTESRLTTNFVYLLYTKSGSRSWTLFVMTSSTSALFPSPLNNILFKLVAVGPHGPVATTYPVLPDPHRQSMLKIRLNPRSVFTDSESPSSRFMDLMQIPQTSQQTLSTISGSQQSVDVNIQSANPDTSESTAVICIIVLISIFALVTIIGLLVCRNCHKQSSSSLDSSYKQYGYFSEGAEWV